MIIISTSDKTWHASKFPIAVGYFNGVEGCVSSVERNVFRNELIDPVLFVEIRIRGHTRQTYSMSLMCVWRRSHQPICNGQFEN